MIDNRILTLAALQHGLIARTQLYGFGISAKRIQRARTSGWFRPIFPDVFLIAPSADTFAMRCRAIQLWVDCVASLGCDRGRSNTPSRTT